jgi:1,4-dihydroxy-2-naphthoyl-CoA hydrolase
MDKSVWFNENPTPADMNKLGEGTMGDFLGMIFTEIGPDFIKGTMPVDERTRQPYGLLHGGASAAFAETLGSVASTLVIDHSRYYCVGLEINANHVRSASKGVVTGICKAVHLGRTTHVWDIRIFDEREKLVCISRLTVAIIQRDTVAK